MQTHSPRRSFAALYLALALMAWLGAGCAPSGPKALLQGEELVRKGNYEAAIAKLKIATDLLRNDARAWNYLGLAYHGAGQYGEAIISYQRAQQLDQNLAAARYNLGELYLEQGNPVSAADELAIFTALQPKSVEGWVRLGDAHLQNQRLDRAQTSYYTALNLKRETPEAFNGLGLILLQRKNPRDAYRYFVEANKYDSNYAPAILNMAVVAQSHLSALPTALTKYREYLAKAPDAPNASAVQAAIRQLDAELNPRPVREETRVAVAEPPAAPAPATNRPAPAVARTEVSPPKPTNAVPAANTNAAPVLVTRTNPPTTTVASAATNARPATASNRPAPAPATNKPPVQVAKADIPAAPPATKPATEVRPATETATASKPAPVRESVPTVPQEKAVANSTSSEPSQAQTPPPVAVIEEEPPLEVVTLEETVIQPAGEIEPATEIQATTTPPPVITPASTAQTSAPQMARVEEPAQPERRGFFQRINPVNLFRSDDDDESSKRPMSKVTPLPPDTSAAPTEEPVQSTPAPTTVALARQPEASAPATPAPTPAPAPVTGPRYQYGKIKQPVAGDRPTAERLFERGIGAQSRRDAGGAATFFAAAAEADPSYFAAHYNLGLAGYSAGQWFKALSAFETALVLEPNSAEARYNFALTLQKSGFPVDAARELETLLQQRPEDTRAMLLLGNVYAQDLREIPAARRQYQQVLAREPQHPQATGIRYWLAAHP